MSKNFLGLRIDGDITRGAKRADQRPLEELTPLLEAVLNHPDLIALRWRQYTPYFNDGDPCEFGVDDMTIKVRDVVEDKGDYEDGFMTAFDFKYYKLPIDNHLAEALTELNESTSAFENVLLELFGDHAIVTINKGQNIDLEFYEHE